MQCVTAVDGHWLAELGPMFFSVKESNRSRLVSHSLTFSLVARTVSMVTSSVSLQEKKQAAKQKLSQMEAELEAASQEMNGSKGGTRCSEAEERQVCGVSA